MSRKAIQRETAALRLYVERRADKGVELEDLAVALVTVADEHADLVPAEWDREEYDLDWSDWLRRRTNSRRASWPFWPNTGRPEDTLRRPETLCAS